MGLEKARNGDRRSGRCRRFRRNGSRDGTNSAAQGLKFAFIRHAPKFRWVGFDGSFGVKLLGRWAVESGVPPISSGGKYFK
jgi:hypothetical protein